MENKIKKKIDNVLIKGTNKAGVLSCMVFTFVVPYILLIFKSFIFGLCLSLLISYIIYRIQKETYLINNKIIKGDAINILWVMSALSVFSFCLITLTLKYSYWFSALLIFIILFKLNTLGEYYNIEEIKNMK